MHLKDVYLLSLPIVATHTYNPSPWKAARVATWEVQGKPGLQNKFLSQKATKRTKNPKTKIFAYQQHL